MIVDGLEMQPCPFLLTLMQMRHIQPHFPLSHGAPRVDDHRVVSGIIFVIQGGLRWRDAPTASAPKHGGPRSSQKAGSPPDPGAISISTVVGDPTSGIPIPQKNSMLLGRGRSRCRRRKAMLRRLARKKMSPLNPARIGTPADARMSAADYTDRRRMLAPLHSNMLFARAAPAVFSGE
jgi:transposase